MEDLVELGETDTIPNRHKLVRQAEPLPGDVEGARQGAVDGTANEQSTRRCGHRQRSLPGRRVPMRVRLPDPGGQPAGRAVPEGRHACPSGADGVDPRPAVGFGDDGLRPRPVRPVAPTDPPETGRSRRVGRPRNLRDLAHPRRHLGEQEPGPWTHERAIRAGGGDRIDRHRGSRGGGAPFRRRRRGRRRCHRRHRASVARPGRAPSRGGQQHRRGGGRRRGISGDGRRRRHDGGGRARPRMDRYPESRRRTPSEPWTSMPTRQRSPG